MLRPPAGLKGLAKFKADIKAIQEEFDVGYIEARRIYRERKGLVSLTEDVPPDEPVIRDPNKEWTMQEVLDMANADPDGPSGWINFVPEDTVTVGWNGLSWNLTRGLEHKVPRCIYEVYMNSVTETRRAYLLAEEQLKARPAARHTVSYEGWLRPET
jgi:hypothetical protein